MGVEKETDETAVARQHEETMPDDSTGDSGGSADLLERMEKQNELTTFTTSREPDQIEERIGEEGSKKKEHQGEPYSLNGANVPDFLTQTEDSSSAEKEQNEEIIRTITSTQDELSVGDECEKLEEKKRKSIDGMEMTPQEPESEKKRKRREKKEKKEKKKKKKRRSTEQLSPFPLFDA